jgi:glycosyltransferase involved in cell wall biosynthesis
MNTKKKIVIVGPAYPLRGGLAAYNERIAKAFMEQGHDVKIESFKLQYPSFLFPGKTQYSTDPAPEGININTSVNSINPFNWIKVGWKIRKMNPDLVIIKFWLPFMAPCFGTIAHIIKWKREVPLISIIDNIIPHEKRAFDRMLSNYFVKGMSAFIAMSKSVLNDLNTFDKKKPKLFSPHPLYDHYGEINSKIDARKKLGLNPVIRYLLFFGFIRDYKGLDLLLKAFADGRLRNKNVKLIVAGEFYTDSKPYENLIAENQLQNFVFMDNNFIPDSKVADYFNAADVIVQPYKTATQSGVTQIGYHFEKPMIVTDVGGLSEIIPHKKVGFVVQPEVKEITEALLEFLELPEGYFDKNIKIEKQKYSWDRMLETIDLLIEQLATKKK